jgi:hypothetical protein
MQSTVSRIYSSCKTDLDKSNIYMEWTQISFSSYLAGRGIQCDTYWAFLASSKEASDIQAQYNQSSIEEQTLPCLLKRHTKLSYRCVVQWEMSAFKILNTEAAQVMHDMVCPISRGSGNQFAYQGEIPIS